MKPKEESTMRKSRSQSSTTLEADVYSTINQAKLSQADNMNKEGKIKRACKNGFVANRKESSSRNSNCVVKQADNKIAIKRKNSTTEYIEPKCKKNNTVNRDVDLYEISSTDRLNGEKETSSQTTNCVAKQGNNKTATKRKNSTKEHIETKSDLVNRKAHSSADSRSIGKNSSFSILEKRKKVIDKRTESSSNSPEKCIEGSTSGDKNTSKRRRVEAISTSRESGKVKEESIKVNTTKNCASKDRSANVNKGSNKASKRNSTFGASDKKSQDVSKSKDKTVKSTDKSSDKVQKRSKVSKSNVKEQADINVKSTERDPMALLMMMEGLNNKGNEEPSMTLVDAGPSSSSQKQSSDDDDELMDSDEAESDWEDVHDQSLPEERSQIPDGPVEITIPDDGLQHRKRKKKSFDWKAYYQRKLKRFKKEVAEDMHKVHLLCLLSLSMRQNSILNDEVLKGMILSMLPDYLLDEKVKKNEERLVENVHNWYKKKFPLSQIKQCSDMHMMPLSKFMKAVSTLGTSDARLWVLLFISILRTVGLSVRLVFSFQPVPFKGVEVLDSKDSKKRKQTAIKNDSEPTKKSPSSKGKEANKSHSVQTKKSPKPTKSVPAQKRQSSNRKSSKDAALKTKKDLNSEDDGDLSEEELNHKRKRKQKAKLLEENSPNLSSDTEFDDSITYHRSPDLKANLKIGSNRKVLSETEEDISKQPKLGAGHDFWLEVYFTAKKKWVCFDCFKCAFGKPYSLENCATQPISYVFGFRNDGSVKDVTPRYAKQWLTHTRKARIHEDWLVETLMYFDKASFQDNRLEDDEIKGQLLVRPMPTSISELKSHPLYALRRHLLKFEAIYPDSAIPLGYIKKEPVYARECVRTLHSRDNWLKEGRLVRVKEEPYKMVKSRPKWNKPKDNPDELDLELYGEWQTEKYIPPPAVNGKVPRNEYGNLELFKPWMLPVGTAQVRGNNIQRVAKKLGIDAAPAMVGWDHHCGYAHPVFDGVVVCEEYAETLSVAVEEDNAIQRQREFEKREKRVYGNWRKLIRGLMIKAQLTKKFLEKPGSQLTDQKEEKPSTTTGVKSENIKQSWPQNRQEDNKAIVSMKGTKQPKKSETVEKSELIEGLSEESLSKIQQQSMKLKESTLMPSKKKHEIGKSFSGVREVVENLNISEDSDSEEEVISDTTKQNSVYFSKQRKQCNKPIEDTSSSKAQTKVRTKQKKIAPAKKNKQRYVDEHSSDSDYCDDIEPSEVKKRSRRLNGRVNKKVNYCEPEEIEGE